MCESPLNRLPKSWWQRLKYILTSQNYHEEYTAYFSMAGCVINTSNTLDKHEFREEHLIKNSSKKCSYQMHLSISSSFTWHQILPIHNRMTIPILLDWFCFSSCPKFTCVSFVFWYIPRAQHKEQAVKSSICLTSRLLTAECPQARQHFWV